MKRRRVIGLLGVTATTGCLRLTTSDDSSETSAPTTERATATPERQPTTRDPTTDDPTADDPTTDAQPSYPAGLSDDGATSTLFDTQVSALSLNSFAVQWTKLDVTGSESNVHSQRQYRVDGARAVGQLRRPEGGYVEVYVNSNGTYWREQLTDGYTYGLDAATFDLGNVTWSVELKPLLDAIDWRGPELVADGDPAVWELSAAGLTDGEHSPSGEPGHVVDVADATLRVRSDGIIPSFAATYTVRETWDGGSEEQTFDVEYSLASVGDVSASDPSWSDTARTDVPSVSASMAMDGDAVAFTVDSGNRLEAGSGLGVERQDGGDRLELTLDEPLDPGTTAYLYKASKNDDSAEEWVGGISRDDPPGSTPPEGFDGDYEVEGYRGRNNYFPSIDVV